VQLLILQRSNLPVLKVLRVLLEHKVQLDPLVHKVLLDPLVLKDLQVLVSQEQKTIILLHQVKPVLVQLIQMELILMFS